MSDTTSTNGAATKEPVTTMVVRTEADLRTARDAFEPTTNKEAYDHAQRLVSSGLMPKALQTPAQVYVAIVMGRELGLSAMQSVRSIHVIEGKPCLSADLITGLVKKSPLCEYFQCIKSTAEAATYKTQRRGNPEPTEFSFTIQDAQRAGLTGKMVWKQYPAAMLRARCATALARAEFSDLVAGLYDPEEMERTTAPSLPPPARRTAVATVLPREPAPRPTEHIPAMGDAPESEVVAETGEVVDAQEPPPADEPPEAAAQDTVPSPAPVEPPKPTADSIIARMNAAAKLDDLIAIANEKTSTKSALGDGYPAVLAAMKARRASLSGAK